MKKATSKKVSKKKTVKKVKKTAPSKKILKKKVPANKKPAAKKSTAQKQSASIIKSGTPQIGDFAPGFRLFDQNGKSISLADYIGSNVVVYFYPRAMTPGCTVQACGLRDSDSTLKNLDVVVLGISPDPVNKLKQFEDKQHLNFTLLSDADHKVAEAYGSWGLKKFMGREFMGVLRQSFLIDKKGRVAHVMHKVDTKSHHQDIINFFKHH